MESNAFGSNHLPSQALVVLSEAASGLHEALRGQRPFPSRLPDAKDLHNMSLVGNYSTHLLHSFHPHLLQTLNHNMLAANGGAGGPASYFASERTSLGKPSVLSNFSLPSAFSPPKYIGISLDQNLFNGSESFRTDSASPTCTSHESMEGSQDYDGEKGESPRSNNSQDPRDLRHIHNKATPACSSASSSSSSSSSAPPVGTPTLVASTASLTAGTPTVVAAHLAQQQHHHAAHHAAHAHHHTHPHLPQHALPPPPHHAHHHHHHGHPNGSLLAATMGGLGMTLRAGMSLASLSSAAGALSAGAGGVGGGGAGGPVPDICPVCGIKLSNADDWNSHFLAELDRLYKLSAGMERTNLQATYMFAPPCPTQENAIRTSHNRWETFQRIRNNRQNRLRIKVRKRKYGDMYMMENLFCNSCPICKRKYALETGKLPTEEETKMQEEIETVDVESCNDDVPDSGSELQPTQLALGGQNGGHISNMHNSNNQPGKLDGILYRTACVINKEATASVSGGGGGEDDVTTNVATTSSGTGGSWSEVTHTANNNTPTQGHISVKNVSELSSTTHHFYNADSCGDERSHNGAGSGMSLAGMSGGGGIGSKDIMMDTCNNDSDEDVIVDDDDSVKMTTTAPTTTTTSTTTNNNSYCINKQKRKYEDSVGSSSRANDNNSPMDERPRSEPQVTSSEQSMEITNTNNNNNHHMKYTAADNVGGGGGGADTIAQMAGLTQLDSKVGISSDLKPDEENKCFICKTGIKDLASDSFFRGRNLYFHQSCANVMSSYRMSKELLQQQQQQQQGQNQQQGGNQAQGCLSPAHSPQQSATTNVE